MINNDIPKATYRTLFLDKDITEEKMDKLLDAFAEGKMAPMFTTCVPQFIMKEIKTGVIFITICYFLENKPLA